MLVWASSALLLIALKQMPVFLLEAIIMGFGGLIMILAGQRPSNMASFSVYGLLGIAGNHLSYILALRLIPPAAVDLIYCLWPLLVVVFAYKSFTSKKIFQALLLVTIGLTVLFVHYDFIYSSQFFVGCLIAFIGPLLWALYVTKAPHGNSYFVLGLYLLFGALLSILLSSTFNEHYSLTLQDLIYLALLSIGPCSLAYMLWDKALIKSELNLSFLGYLIPISSYSMLIIFAVVKLDITVLLALALLSLGGIIINT